MGRTGEIEEIVLHPFGGSPVYELNRRIPKPVPDRGGQPAASFFFDHRVCQMLLTAMIRFNFGTAFFFFIGAKPIAGNLQSVPGLSAGWRPRAAGDLFGEAGIFATPPGSPASADS